MFPLEIPGAGKIGFIAGAVAGAIVGLVAIHFVDESWDEKLMRANSETVAAQTRAGICAASVEQIAHESAAAQSIGTAAQSAAAAQGRAAEVRTVTVTQYIKEAPKCSEALQRAWQSAPQ